MKLVSTTLSRILQEIPESTLRMLEKLSCNLQPLNVCNSRWTVKPQATIAASGLPKSILAPTLFGNRSHCDLISYLMLLLGPRCWLGAPRSSRLPGARSLAACSKPFLEERASESGFVRLGFDQPPVSKPFSMSEAMRSVGHASIPSIYPIPT